MSSPAAPDTSASDQALLASVRSLGEAPPKGGNMGVLLVTAALFIGLGGARGGWLSIVLLAFAIALHEIGHVLAMRTYGYKNVRMLFIPLFGGLATGEPQELDATKNALVALAGPAFGLLTAAIAGLIAMQTSAPAWLVSFAWMSVFLNAFNLLPLMPLDGGRFANDALFSRYPTLELVFRITAVATLGILAWYSRDWLLGGLALFMLVTTPAAYTRARLVRDVRRDPAWQTRTMDVETVGLLREHVTRLFRGLPREKYEQRLPGEVQALWLEIRKQFPSPAKTVGLLGAYLSLWVLVLPLLLYCLSRGLPKPAF